MWEEPNQDPQTERGGKEQTSCRREKVKGGYFGHELLGETSLFPSSVASLYPRLAPFPPTEEHCPCGSGAKGKSVSLNVLLSPFCLSPLSLFQYLPPVFSSAASSKCLQITQLWNSTLHLYLCLLGQYASCGLRFCPVADKKKSS